MSLLLGREALLARGVVAANELAPLSRGLRDELEPLLASPPLVPTAKALLTRAGGRCEVDGALLSYDPVDARHRCPQCGREHAGEIHDRFRLYWHQLWLAERVLHAAVLGTLLDDGRCRSVAASLLDAYAAQYLQYPNADNVLGPSRPFFSTYLESIWTLQLCIALDLLETHDSGEERRALGGRVRDRLVAPSAALIASYDEGMSNRQVWNNAALLAAGTLLRDDAMVDRAIAGPSGLEAHLSHALLADGSWYEGENYHLFAHRGLWYAVQMAEHRGRPIGASLTARFRDGFAAPFRTLLPDLTFPSRRDSQYAVSVRQPRFAESCELGLARGDDDRLLGMLARLYEPGVPRGDTGRARTSADVERNLAATCLTRADLSWRALLFARPVLPPLVGRPFESDLLPAQGIGILRREGGALFAALDYGHSGGGHGHPDRLDLLLVRGDRRWFDDPGTGSYVDRTLHWYRSTLAHNAPLVDGRSQPRVHGRLLAFQDTGDAGWVSAEASLAEGLRVRRSLVLLDDYMIDLLEWHGDAPHDVALPLHGVELVDAAGVPLPRRDSALAGGAGAEDGFDFLERTARVDGAEGVVRALSVPRGLHGWIDAGSDATWWSALAPAAPGRAGPVPLGLVRRASRIGRYLSVWSWGGSVLDVQPLADGVRVRRADGSSDEHAVDPARGWRIACGGVRPAILLAGMLDGVLGGVLDGVLDGVLGASSARAPAPLDMRTVPEGDDAVATPLHLPAAVRLGERHYRASELAWSEAGRPGAVVQLALDPEHRLVVRVAVTPSHRQFVSVDADNPLDNEPAAINGDGVQLYVTADDVDAAWLLVPVSGGTAVGMRRIDGWTAPIPLAARWQATARGYELRAELSLPPAAERIGVDVIVNETVPGRARRRGQLVLSGARGEFVYLRGDRHERSRLLRLHRPDA